MYKTKRLLIVSACLFVIYTGSGQELSVGAGVGASTYWGDLNSGAIFQDIKNSSGLQGQLFITYQPSRIFTLRGNLAVGKIMGDDALSEKDWQRERNLSFQTRLLDFSGRVMVHPWSIPLNDSHFVLTPFISSGLSVFNFDPRTTYNGNMYRLQPLGTEGQGMPGFGEKYQLTQLSIPIGGGLKMQVSERMSVIIESYAHKTFTDYIDDVGAQYVNYFELLAGNGLLAAQLSDRSPEALGLSEPIDRPTGSAKGGKFGDYYFMTSVSVVYRLASNNKRRVSKFGGDNVICPDRSSWILRGK
ncbi:MAG: DUF6089 family protein [Saprospiraceae bacterium]